MLSSARTPVASFGPACHMLPHSLPLGESGLYDAVHTCFNKS